MQTVTHELQCVLVHQKKKLWDKSVLLNYWNEALQAGWNKFPIGNGGLLREREDEEAGRRSGFVV